MSDIATLSLRVNTSELERGNQELDRFQQTAGGAANKADDLNRVFRAGAEPQKKNAQSLKEQQQELQNLLNKISPVNRALNELEDLQSSLATFRGKGMIDDEDFARYAAVLDTTRDKLGKVMEAETADGRAKLEQAQAAQKAAASQEAFLKTITDQTATFKASKADIAEYRAAQMGISEQAAPIIAQMREQERAVAREADQKRAAAIATRGLKQAIAEQETAERSAAAEARRAENTRNSYIRSLQDQANAIGKTRTELMQMKAAELGVSAQAAPFIARLREQDEAWKKGTISAGQYRQALRMLPAQFTDIATSLAGGMPVWMVMMQQGGQISDSFGGLSGLFRAIKDALFGVSDAADDSGESLTDNANSAAESVESFRTLRGIITPTRLALGGLAAAAIAVSVAYVKGQAERDKFNESIFMTGNYAGATTAQLQNMAKETAKAAGGTVASAAAAIAQLNGFGSMGQSQIRMATEAAIALEQATGQSIDKTIDQFKRLATDPLKAIVALNENYHFLTAEVYNQIAALEEQGQTQAAAKLATEEYSKAVKSRTDEISENLGYLQSGWNNIKDAASNAWDAMLGIGREDPAKRLAAARAILQNTPSFVDRGDAEEVVYGDMASTLKADIEGSIKQAEQARVDAMEKIRALEKQTLSNAEKREKEEKQIHDWKLKGYITAEKEQKLLASVREKFKDPKTPKGRAYIPPAGSRAGDTAQAELLALQAQLRTLQDHKSVTDVISQQRKDLQLTEARFAVLEEASTTRKLSKQEQSLLASKEHVLQLARQKALIGDQITAQEQLNKRMDTARKYVTQMKEKRGALEIGSTMSDRLAQRELAKGQLASGWQNAGGSLSDKGYQDELKAAEDYYAAEDKLRGDWLAGAEKGWAEYADSATNALGSAQQVAQAGFNGLADMMTNLVTTGKSSIKEFGVSMLKMIVEVINKLLIAQAIQLAMGWISSGASASAGATSSNAFSGGAYSNLSMAYNGGFIPEYDSGGYTGDGGKYEPKGVVHGGEFVFTKEATKRIGVPNLYTMMRGYAGGGVVGGAAPMYGLQSSGDAGVNVQTSVVVQTGDTQQKTSGSNEALGKAYKQTIDRAVTEGIQRESRPGGLIWSASKSR